jgi:hypothetical protein
MRIFSNFNLLITMLFVTSVLPVAAGTLYKCVDTKGIASYQQAACPNEAKVASVRTYKPVADNSSSSWSSQRYRQTSSKTVYQQAQSGGSNSQNNVSNQDMSERIRRADHAASTMRGSPTARNAAIAAALGQPNPGQWSPPDAPKSTQQRIDQNGNSYTHPAGSSVITDNQTGKTCIVNGNQIVECH